MAANPHDAKLSEAERLNDQYVMLALRDEVLKEGYMKEVEMRLVRGVLKKCLETEGNNKHMVCHDLLVRYIDLLRAPRMTGYRDISGAKPPIADAKSTGDYMRRTQAMKEVKGQGL